MPVLRASHFEQNQKMYAMRVAEQYKPQSKDIERHPPRRRYSFGFIYVKSAVMPSAAVRGYSTFFRNV